MRGLLSIAILIALLIIAIYFGGAFGHPMSTQITMGTGQETQKVEEDRNGRKVTHLRGVETKEMDKKKPSLNKDSSSSEEDGSSGEEGTPSQPPASPNRATSQTMEKIRNYVQKVMKELGKHNQRFTLRLIKMTAKEDLEQMPELMKDFDISARRPVFFIAGGLKTPMPTPSPSTTSMPSTTSTTTEPSSTSTTTSTTPQLPSMSSSPSVSDEMESSTTLESTPDETSTATMELETTPEPVAPVVVPTEDKSRHALILLQSVITSAREDNVEAVTMTTTEPTEPVMATVATLEVEATKLKIKVESAQKHIDSVRRRKRRSPFRPLVPGRMARTENPFDDEDDEHDCYRHHHPGHHEGIIQSLLAPLEADEKKERHSESLESSESSEEGKPDTPSSSTSPLLPLPAEETEEVGGEIGEEVVTEATATESAESVEAGTTEATSAENSWDSVESGEVATTVATIEPVTQPGEEEEAPTTTPGSLYKEDSGSPYAIDVQDVEVDKKESDESDESDEVTTAMTPSYKDKLEWIFKYSEKVNVEAKEGGGNNDSIWSFVPLTLNSTETLKSMQTVK